MIQTASFIGLIKTLLILVLIYIIIKFIMRLFAPIIVGSLIRKISSMYNQNHSYDRQQNEGDITIDNPSTKKQSNNDFGDYVDYEEID